MHEASLVASLLRQTVQLAAAHAADKVEQIRISVGSLAGVEPLLLQEAFLRLRHATIAEEAELIIEDVGLTCHCGKCQLTFNSPDIRGCCPACQAPAEIVAGDAVVLESIRIHVAEESDINA